MIQGLIAAWCRDKLPVSPYGLFIDIITQQNEIGRPPLAFIAGNIAG
jgi:hypothetical protein